MSNAQSRGVMEPFKNLFNKSVAENIADAVKRNYSAFNKKAFLKNIDKELDKLELKGRVHFLAVRLHDYLPKELGESIHFLLGALKQNEKDHQGISGMAVWPLTHFVSLYGLENFELSMLALKEMTKEFTSEFAVRPFFVKDQKKVMKFFKEWVDDESEHVRRWVSEGSRPLLPWGMKLQDFVSDPELTWIFLEKLKNDPSEYVRKSVANHINDHSKNHPDFVVEKLLEWHKSNNKSDDLSWIIKHASRSLIKKGNKKAFQLHGVESFNIKVVEQKILSKKVKIGEVLRVSITLQNASNKKAQIILDHDIHLLRANGKHNVKVFKGKKMLLLPKEKIQIKLSIPFKVVTTRAYYPGKHFWNVKINGTSELPLPFQLSLK